VDYTTPFLEIDFESGEEEGIEMWEYKSEHEEAVYERMKRGMRRGWLDME